MERTAAAPRSAASPVSGTEVELAIGRGNGVSETPSVVIVDDHAIFRTGVKAELPSWSRSSARPRSVEEAARAITELEPDVVLLDVHMPGGGGVEVIGQVAARPQQRFLALSVSDDPRT